LNWLQIAKQKPKQLRKTSGLRVHIYHADGWLCFEEAATCTPPVPQGPPKKLIEKGQRNTSEKPNPHTEIPNEEP
jgi:hypothetical protein